jgi:hypothetical protein
MTEAGELFVRLWRDTIPLESWQIVALIVLSFVTGYLACALLPESKDEVVQQR